MIGSAYRLQDSLFVHSVEPPHTCVRTGERIAYRVHYGILNAAEAIVETDSKIHTVNNRPCYRAVVSGRTTGFIGWVAKVEDTWQSWIDTTTYLPYQFYMKKQEAKYHTAQKYVFDQTANLVHQYDLEKPTQEKKTQKVPPQIQDVVSFSYLMRNLDYSKMKPNEVASAKAFFEGQIYDVKVRYRGKEEIKTKFGKIKTFRLNPFLPKTELFDNQEPIKIWVSDDLNKIPVRIEVELKIGSLKMDLREYSGLKTEPKFY
jgi:hypothetical protein